MKHSTKKKTFLQGMVRSLDLFGSIHSDRYKDAISSKKIMSNHEALIRDWKIVGDTFKVSVSTYAQKKKLN